jgi:hypothetical protein
LFISSEMLADLYQTYLVNTNINIIKHML